MRRSEKRGVTLYMGDTPSSLHTSRLPPNIPHTHTPPSHYTTHAPLARVAFAEIRSWQETRARQRSDWYDGSNVSSESSSS